MFDWESRMKTLPELPGIYIMKKKNGDILYIGKAKNLKRRIRQYFQEGTDTRPFVRKLPSLLHKIDILLTNTEKEALLLEATMIQKEQPRFNILLKEEKRYLYLKLDTGHSFPRLEVIRRSLRDKAPKPTERLFGPYRSGYTLRKVMDVIGRCFRLRTCDDREMRNRVRPCLEYQIKRCDAPCCLAIKPEIYQIHVDDVIMFLEGKHDQLQHELTTKMQHASRQRDYEIAARYRDQLHAIQTMLEEQYSLSTGGKMTLDIFGFYREEAHVEIQLLTMRDGRLSGGQSFAFSEQEFDDHEVLERFLPAYYLRDGIDMPQEIVLPCSFEGTDELAALLSDRRNRKIRIVVPQKGEKASLVRLANKNAEQGFLEKQKVEDVSKKRLRALQKRLDLSRYPYRIECIDNSHMQGRYPVSAIVVFEGGYLNRSATRRYHIKEAKGGDDYAAMKEILSRRFRRGIKEGNLPDLLLIDGGRGQLEIAYKVLEELALDAIDLAAIAKKKRQGNGVGPTHEFDRIYQRHRRDPVIIQPKFPELIMLARCRDETHRSAVNFHKKTREKQKIRSVLESIPHIGPKRKKALLEQLGSLQRIQEASIKELLAIPEMNLLSSNAIIAFFKKNKDSSS